MDWMGQKRRDKERAEKEELLRELGQTRHAITALSARLNCAESFIMALLETREPSRKQMVLSAASDFVVKLGDIKPPPYVDLGMEQDFRNELSRALQVFIEIAKAN